MKTRRIPALLGLSALLVVTWRVGAQQPAPKPAEGPADFAPIARVLQSPRCRNCHPVGDAPLQGDPGTPHAMNVVRASPAAGLPCTTCHREKNAELAGGPPGAPGWHMPSAATPMPFEGRTPAELCAQLKDPKRNGGRTPEQLADHMDHDALVRWAWDPGGGRAPPPGTHAELVRQSRAWVAAGAPCP